VCFIKYLLLSSRFRNLARTQLTGSIPTELGQIFSLQDLYDPFPTSFFLSVSLFFYFFFFPFSFPFFPFLSFFFVLRPVHLRFNFLLICKVSRHQLTHWAFPKLLAQPPSLDLFVRTTSPSFPHNQASFTFPPLIPQKPPRPDKFL